MKYLVIRSRLNGPMGSDIQKSLDELGIDHSILSVESPDIRPVPVDFIKLDDSKPNAGLRYLSPHLAMAMIPEDQSNALMWPKCLINDCDEEVLDAADWRERKNKLCRRHHQQEQDGFRKMIEGTAKVAEDVAKRELERLNAETAPFEMGREYSVDSEICNQVDARLERPAPVRRLYQSKWLADFLSLLADTVRPPAER